MSYPSPLRQLFLGAATLAFCSAGFAETGMRIPESEPGEIIVKLRAQGEILPFRDADIMGLELVATAGAGGELRYRLSFDAFMSFESAAAMAAELEKLSAELQARPDVLYAQPNWIVRPLSHDAPRAGDTGRIYLSNGLTNLAADPAMIHVPGPALRLAILDEGPSPGAVLVAPGGLAGIDMVSDPDRAGDGDGRDDDPEAGPVAGCPLPSAPGDAVWLATEIERAAGAAVAVQPLRVMGRCDGAIADVNDAIRWAAGLDVPGIRPNPSPAHIIAMRFAGGVPCSRSPATQAALDDAAAAGARLIAVIGQGAPQGLPGDCRGVVVTAATY